MKTATPLHTLMPNRVERSFQITRKKKKESFNHSKLAVAVYDHAWRCVPLSPVVSSHQQTRRLRGFRLPGSVPSLMKLAACSHARKNTLTLDILLPNRVPFLSVSLFSCFSLQGCRRRWLWEGKKRSYRCWQPPCTGLPIS